MPWGNRRNWAPKATASLLKECCQSKDPDNILPTVGGVTRNERKWTGTKVTQESKGRGRLSSSVKSGDGCSFIIFQWDLYTLKPSQGWLVWHTKLCWWHVVALDSCATLLLVPIQDLVHLREASVSGAPFTAILPNRKRSGELFLNLLDVRGLTVARTHTQNCPSFYFVSSNYISKPDRILLDGICCF